MFFVIIYSKIDKLNYLRFMSERKNEIIVEVPHRISGFFEIVDEFNGSKIEDPVKIGSRGAGFNISSFGKTKITSIDREGNDKYKIEIYINGKNHDRDAETTYSIVEYVKKLVKKPFYIRIEHFFDLPVGCGYGASGSGALGTIYGLNHLFDLGFSNKEKGKIAHIAEVVNKTGLGTICGQLRGGLCMLTEPGYPCVSERIKIPKNLKIVCGTFGSIHTKSILTNPVLNLRIKKAGKIALKRLLLTPNIKTFINESFKFVKNSDILELLELPKIKELIESLNKLNIMGASMNQLGRSVYAICKIQNEKEVLDVFESYNPDIQILVTSIFEKNPVNLL